MNFKHLLLLAFALLTLGTLNAQPASPGTTVEEIFRGRREICFEFDATGLDLHKLSKMISIDKVNGHTVFAYANSREFASFLDLGVDYTIKPKPGEMLKNPKMLDKVDIRGITDWDFYPTYDAYIDMMYQYAEDYPDLCEVFSIGESTEGRQLMMARITKNPGQREAEPQFLYTGTIHGDETTGFILLLRMIDHLLQNYGTDPVVTNLIDHSEIWINSASNPDGTYAGGNNTVNGATRYNANGVDCNRNYPDPQDGPHPDGNDWQPETVAFMQLAEDQHFVMSANTHGGAEVINYPWDRWPRLAADNDWWYTVSRAYADTVHLYSASNYLRDLNDGITNGYAWYSVSGGRQDYMNFYQNCREVTMELSSTKLLPPSQLPDHWEWNYRSLINYMEESMFGVNGIVTDQETGDPLEAKVYIEGHDMDNSFVYADPENGYYQRLLAPGTYDITYSAAGHYPVTIENVEVTAGQVNTVDVQLDAGDLIADFSASTTTIPIGGTVDFTDESFGNPVAWEWNFEGGNPATSTAQNPEGISWDATGTYDVSLTITNDGGDEQTITKPDFISVNAEYLMTNQTVTTCEGVFYDSGGETGNYQDDEDYTMTFMPGTTGSKLIVDFESFDVEENATCDYDWMKIYDGSSASATLIGTYCGTDSPGTLEATNTEGALTFVFHSDYSVNKAGWKAVVSCTEPPLLPLADFIADQTNIDQGQSVQFTDLSENSPTTWAWTFEGGTPASSSEQNPQVNYEEPGLYDVTLIVQNEFGSDSKTMTDYITVNSTIGIGERSEDGLTIYPNPVSGEVVNIEADRPVECVEVYDLTGKCLLTLENSTATAQVRLTGLDNGIYLIRVKTGDSWKNSRISIQK